MLPNRWLAGILGATALVALALTVANTPGSSNELLMVAPQQHTEKLFLGEYWCAPSSRSPSSRSALRWAVGGMGSYLAAGLWAVAAYLTLFSRRIWTLVLRLCASRQNPALPSGRAGLAGWLGGRAARPLVCAPGVCRGLAPGSVLACRGSSGSIGGGEVPHPGGCPAQDHQRPQGRWEVHGPVGRG